MTFSVYSPSGLALVWALGQMTTRSYGRAEVGRAASSARWTVEYALPGPTSNSSGFAVLDPGVPVLLSSCSVSPLMLDTPSLRVIASRAEPNAVLAGTVNVIFVSDQLPAATGTAAPLSVSLADGPDEPKPNPVTVTVPKAVPLLRRYG